MGYKKSCLG